MEFVTGEHLLVLGLLWLSFKALVTVLLLLGAGRLLRRTRFAPFVARIEAHLEARLPFRVRLGRSR